MKESVKLFGLNSAYSLFFCNHAFAYKIHRYLESRLSRSLAVSCLKHVEVAVLDCELHVLHILEIIFKSCGYILELSVYLGHILFKFGNRRRSSYTGNDVLALGIDKILAHESLFACRGISCESNACSRMISGVAERHLLNVDCCAPLIGNFVHLSVDVCSRIVP